MKTSLKTGFLVWAVILSGNVMAQENTQADNNLLHYYDRELFQWDYDFWSGLSLNYQNQNSRTVFGLKDSMKKALALYDDSYQKYRTYRAKNTWGHILFWGGYAAVLSSPFIITYGARHDSLISQETAIISLGVMGGGLLSSLIGSLLMTSGQEDIFDAIKSYNRHRIIDYTY